MRTQTDQPAPTVVGVNRIWVAFAVLVLSISSGCATHLSRVHQAHEAFFSGDLERSTALLDQAVEKSARSRDCALLDRAIVQLVAGETDEAEQLLRGVRDRFEHFDQSSGAEQGLAWVSDERAIAYAGEDYEKVLIHAFLALADLMHHGGDATAYCLQMEQKQLDIVDAAGSSADQNPKLGYQQVAFGAYLRGVLHESSHLNYDDAQRCYALAASYEPSFDVAKRDSVRASHRAHSQPGNGVVYIFGLVGRGPYKDTTTVQASNAALLMAESILFATGNRKLPPVVAPIKVPQIVVPSNRVDCIKVVVNGSPAGLTETVTDVGQMAVRQQAAIFDQLVARAVARRALKLAATNVAKEALDIGKDNTLASLGLDALGLVWESSERADTRGWGLLPERIQVRRLELPAGEHDISLSAAKHGMAVGPEFSRRVTVFDGRDTYVLACFPDTQLVGQILTSADGFASRH